MTRGVYLYHFSGKVSDHAGHYLGCSKNIEERDKAHRSGQGVPLIPAALQAGYAVTIVRIWPDQGFEFEQHLKQHYKNNRLLCPICNPSQAEHLYQPNSATQNKA